jgi:hypothetical protein
VKRATVALIAVCLASITGTAAAAQRPMETGFNQFPSSAFGGAEADAAFGLVRDAGGTIVMLNLDWRATAPTQPATLEGEMDPGDPAYAWSSFDELVLNAADAGLTIIAKLDRAPDWASDVDPNPNYVGRTNPKPYALGRFARAAATRYSGTYDPVTGEGGANPLPRVAIWQVWNEPNYANFLRPQKVGTKITSPDLYRAMVNQVAANVKLVQPGNLVLAGGTGPFQLANNTAPFGFMRRLLCLNLNLTKIKGCPVVRFDIWAHHPYTSGAPTRKAAWRHDASLGDLAKMAKVLRVAVAKKTVLSTQPMRFWVDEFGWDTSPPDPKGVPLSLHRRWTAESLMRAWDAGVSAVLQHQLADNDFAAQPNPCLAGHNPYQSGLYFYGSTVAEFAAKPKPSLAAFRFPFVVVYQGKRVRIWGRTPVAKPAKVVIQRRVGAAWKPVLTLRSGGHGIFDARVARPWGPGAFRARAGGELSPAFELRRKLPNPIYRPFGSYCGG